LQTEFDLGNFAADVPTETEINWEYAANTENPVHGVSVGLGSAGIQAESLAPRPRSLATVDANGYVQDTETKQWLGVLVKFSNLYNSL